MLVAPGALPYPSILIEVHCVSLKRSRLFLLSFPLYPGGFPLRPILSVVCLVPGFAWFARGLLVPVVLVISGIGAA